MDQENEVSKIFIYIAEVNRVNRKGNLQIVIVGHTVKDGPQNWPITLEIL